ncbi:SAM-dependent methyltransferase [Janthinobacterium svalbardensis]|uniref:site-specific DNA-methyltransferase (adenine-specific) n=1 Tax=Janthinobacterium svalbardensis TaxID=368607 RepID=A0A290WSS8_9BURK|nr:BREX-1 system adenine-specific DNA-methyltransferase PglX [Janthinobacterium svalbardensis]ATD59941.1 SAM-dependent methyltransferase [Janthinobacterium svalbardensis]
MNKAKLKSYAPQARKDFIAAVTARANLLGLSEKAGNLEVAASQPQGDVTVIAGQAWSIKVHSQRQQLITRIQKDGFAQTMEAVAYTWFNRFAALRYMELHDYLGHGHRALSSLEGTLPDILAHATDLAQISAVDGGLPGLKPALVTEMKLAGNRDGELYSMLLVAQCNALSNVMPFLFERIDDETELLLPDNLLRTDSVIAKLVSSIAEEDWKQVEIIGWLYQFYISEKKDEVIGKVVKSEDIPAATQLFTPNWIVQYLVQNSVGRLWLMANPASTLKAQWPYYIEPADQAVEVQAQLDTLIQNRVREDGDSLNPESITLLDPACGSGHILVEAYEVLKAIYLERGYQPRSIPRLILEKNLFGLDIDDRAAQMAGFALMMKARTDDRRLFNEPVKLNVLSLQESKGLDADELARALQVGGVNLQSADGVASSEFGEGSLFPCTRPQLSLGESSAAYMGVDQMRQTIAELIAAFAHAKTFGSLIQIPPVLNAKLATMLERLQLALQNGDLYAQAAAEDLSPLVAQAKMLGMQFDAVVANPPYMGTKYLTPILKDYVKAKYNGFEKDLFSAFAARNAVFAKSGGEVAMMSSNVWMFLSSYEEMRKWLLGDNSLNTLIQLSNSGFDGATVFICAFTFTNIHVSNRFGEFIRLVDFSRPSEQGPKTLESIQNRKCGWYYSVKPDDFKKIPGSPIAYWVNDNFRSLFSSSRPFGSAIKVAVGLQTGENNRFVRYWFEVSNKNIYFNNGGVDNSCHLKKKWFPYNKGGDFRKWYGNQEFVVNWENDGYEIKNFMGVNGRLRSRPQNVDTYFRESLSWSDITSGNTAFRYFPRGFIHDVTGMSAFSDDKTLTLKMLGFCNTNLARWIIETTNPTLHFQAGNFSTLPFLEVAFRSVSSEIPAQAIDISMDDWNTSEVSWNFKSNFLIKFGENNREIASCWRRWVDHTLNQIKKLKNLEEENNRLFIEAYGLQGEVSSEVPDSEIILARADREKDSQRLVSYAIGCTMGRYSLDAPGLIYASAGNVGFDIGLYSSFPADADGIVPFTDELWFEDEAASRIREFLLAVWGVDTLAENMAWLAESLGTKSGETPDETIRRYLADKFYKDHLQTYKKRPIYWLFSSGKQGAFQALVYLHRYHEGTLARMRAEYVVPLTGKIQSRIDMLEKDAAAATSTAARNKLAKEVEKLKKKHVELLAYDELLRHHADMRITLDLDDGVKVNYGKFGSLLAEVKAVTGGASDD